MGNEWAIAIVFRQERWRRQQSCMAWSMWQDLLRRRELAWDEAERVSLASGHPFKDRDGVWRSTERRDLAHQALAQWCALRGIAYA